MCTFPQQNTLTCFSLARFSNIAERTSATLHTLAIGPIACGSRLAPSTLSSGRLLVGYGPMFKDTGGRGGGGWGIGAQESEGIYPGRIPQSELNLESERELPVAAHTSADQFQPVRSPPPVSSGTRCRLLARGLHQATSCYEGGLHTLCACSSWNAPSSGGAREAATRNRYRGPHTGPTCLLRKRGGGACLLWKRGGEASGRAVELPICRIDIASLRVDGTCQCRIE